MRRLGPWSLALDQDCPGDTHGAELVLTHGDPAGRLPAETVCTPTSFTVLGVAPQPFRSSTDAAKWRIPPRRKRRVGSSTATCIRSGVDRKRAAHAAGCAQRPVPPWHLPPGPRQRAPDLPGERAPRWHAERALRADTFDGQLAEQHARCGTVEQPGHGARSPLASQSCLPSRWRPADFGAASVGWPAPRGDVEANAAQPRT
jgi:hypothetical protein